MTFQDYLDKINRQFQSGQAREHAYRPAFQNYIEALLPREVLVTNEPARQRVGSPDFILTDKKGIPFAYIETKDIGKSLDNKDYREQFERYKAGLDTLIITDYMEFRLFRRGELKQTVRIAEVQGNRIVPFGDMFTKNEAWVAQFEHMIGGLLNRDGVNITIRSADNLARRMAGGARLFANVIFNALETNDPQFEIADGSLSKQFLSFKQILIGDLNHREFADIYAQTITYGMFAARLHDSTLEDFSRQEAAELIPKSNPFLRRLFQYVASHDLDDRIRWLVDDLAEVFRHADVAALLKDFGRSTQQTDPMIHFYETFLAAYDPKLRDQRGVWYTPQPVVQFIVRAVDEILKTEFGLRDGLADTSKTRVKVRTDNFDKRKQDYKTAEQEVHRVQLLDPACGTGTFLAETVRHIHRRFERQAGIWNSYVGEHLVPRLHGFELLMASYAMAHIKLDLLLRETGYTLTRQNRFKIFLTNALEEHHPDAGTLFWAQWLADEAAQADAVKRDAPVMVVLGNPPYSVSSRNKGSWIQNLIADYKKDLNEKKINLDDDYIKFIRLGQHFIQKNGEGILAFISNNSFIDGITHRQMRKSLLETFDKIYILDLHGNAKKKETTPDGGKDENVFDIMQGVSINIFIKTGRKKGDGFAEVFHHELYGKRNSKYGLLTETSIAKTVWKRAGAAPPNYFFIHKELGDGIDESDGFSITDLFLVSNNGLKTDRDSLFIDFSRNQLANRIQVLLSGNLDKLFIQEFQVINSGSYRIEEAIVGQKFDPDYIEEVTYRPFDNRKIYYDPKLVSRPAWKVMQHLTKKKNFSLSLPRQVPESEQSGCFISDCLQGHKSFSAYNINSIFPLYLYPDTTAEGLFSEKTRRPNLNETLVAELAGRLGRQFSAEKSAESGTFCPLDVLDYVYAVLHTPTYRAKYREFLKIDFPRVPWPTDAAQFARLVALGGQLRRLHLLESAELEELETGFPVGGDNLVGKISYGAGRVSINQSQYFEGVPEAAWQLHIGGYQPAQKWLKDRAGRRLTFEEVMHYQRVIAALAGTVAVMEQLDGAW